MAHNGKNISCKESRQTKNAALYTYYRQPLGCLKFSLSQPHLDHCSACTAIAWLNSQLFIILRYFFIITSVTLKFVVNRMSPSAFSLSHLEVFTVLVTGLVIVLVVEGHFNPGLFNPKLQPQTFQPQTFQP